MKLKKLLDTLDGLDEALAALYEKGADGKYHLQIEDDDNGPLIRAKEHEVGLRQIAERDLATRTQELETANATIAQLKLDAGKDKNQLREQLQAEYAEKEKKLVEQHQKEKEALEKTVKKVYVSDVAMRIANEITDVPDLLIPLLEKRLQVEVVDGEPVTRVLTDDGKASTLTPDDLKSEYAGNKKFERIIRGSSSSGGGASGGNGGSGASKPLAEMTEAERTTLARTDPARFQQLVTAAGGRVPSNPNVK